jgi:hypothetical protein
MENTERYTPPDRGVGDQLHSLGRAGISSIPIVGNAAVELFSTLLSAPLEKRRNRWMEEVADGLRRLEQEQRVIIENLKTDEAFISLFLQASNSAILNHQDEKLKSLRYAVLNAAISIEIKEDLQIIFIRFVGELSSSHIILLRFLCDNEQRFKEVKSYEALFDEFNKFIYEEYISREEFQLLCNDLKGRTLLRISPNVSDFDDIGGANVVVAGSKNEKPMLIVTELGKQFMDFISAPVTNV